jgi:hypothetical protein
MGGPLLRLLISSGPVNKHGHLRQFLFLIGQYKRIFSQIAWPNELTTWWLLGFRGEDFCRNQPMRNKNCLWQPCLLMDRDEINTLYRGLSKEASLEGPL